MGWPAVKTMWLGDVAMRFEDTRWQTIGWHLLVYPLEIAVCTLALVAAVDRLFGKRISPFARGRRSKPHVVFLGIALGLAFATCWVVPGAKGRYFMPLYPCLALLVGLSIERDGRAGSGGVAAARLEFVFAQQGRVGGWLRRQSRSPGSLGFDRFHLAELKQPGWFAAVYVVAALGRRRLARGDARAAFGRATCGSHC